MSYIGRGTENISNVEVLDNLTFNGSASYTLQKSSTNFVPSSANNLLISISGVVQQGNFSVSGSTITFDTTVSASDTCDWILHYGTGLITTVADGAITEAKLGSNAVTTAKINNGAITSAKLDSGLALGKIGQVVENNFTTTATFTNTSYAELYTNTRLTVTPSSTSSKILYQFQAPVVSLGNNRGIFFAVYKSTDGGSSFSSVRDDITKYHNYSSTAGNYYSHVNFMILDAPATTSSIIYTVYAKVATEQIVGDNGNMSAILMEVLA